ncbi:MAG: hypothetical protein ACXWC9_01645 [Pseudobdellovibrionaceae bacterium]
MKFAMPVLSVLSVLLLAVFSVSARAQQGKGEVYQCAISDLKVDVSYGDVVPNVTSSFYLFSNGRTSGVSRVILRLKDKLLNSNKNVASIFAVHLYTSGDIEHSGHLLGEILSFHQPAIQPMSGSSSMSLQFDLNGVSGQIQCQPTKLDYAFINQEIAIDRSFVMAHSQDSNSVATVPSMERKLKATRHLETVGRSYVQSIDEALAADRTCIMGDAEKALAALKKSSAFRSPETLVLKEGRLEFQVDQIIGCLERQLDMHDNEICKIPKIKKLGTTVKVPLCE